MATSPSPPILVWVPGGGVSGGPISNPPVYSQADVTPLVEGQAYIDVVFGSIQTDDTWVLVACEVYNLTDFEPLNIWPGIITDRTTAGFRLQLNGMPDTGNYYLSWAVSGVNIVPVPATMYLLSGPTSGGVGFGVTYTVRLPPSTTVPASVTVTPSDGGAGGSFNVDSVTLSTSSAVATFIYTPASAGTATISVTNSSTLVDPAGIVLTSVVVTYTLTGPSGGVTGVASTNFTATLIGPFGGTLIVTPNDAGVGTAGTFTPTTVSLTSGAPTATFTYTPASTGTKTISTTNDGGLANPSSITYTVTLPALVDGDPVTTWLDSSGNGHDATQTGSARPIFKTAILNGKPVVRYTGAGVSNLILSPAISTVEPYTIFAVIKAINTTTALFTLSTGIGTPPFALLEYTDGGVYNYGRSTGESFAGTWANAWHVLSALQPGGGTCSGYIDGVVGIGTPGAVGPYLFDFGKLGNGDGDIAEVIFYNVTLSGTNRANIEKYLGTKYAISVAGGSAVQPDTVTGLVAWWKADSLG